MNLSPTNEWFPNGIFIFMKLIDFPSSNVFSPKECGDFVSNNINLESI